MDVEPFSTNKTTEPRPRVRNDLPSFDTGGSDNTSDQDQNADQELDALNALLTTIRANLANILRTWGRESQQYASAAEIMRQCLAENLKRLRARSRRVRKRDVHGDGETRMEETPEEVAQEEVVERGIEELMRELTI